MDQSVSDALSVFCGETRIKKQVLARLITWFCQQDRTLQTMIVDRDAISPEDVHGLAQKALERIVAENANPVSGSSESRGETPSRIEAVTGAVRRGRAQAPSAKPPEAPETPRTKAG